MANTNIPLDYEDMRHAASISEDRFRTLQAANTRLAELNREVEKLRLSQATSPQEWAELRIRLIDMERDRNRADKQVGLAIEDYNNEKQRADRAVEYAVLIQKHLLNVMKEARNYIDIGFDRDDESRRLIQAMSSAVGDMADDVTAGEHITGHTHRNHQGGPDCEVCGITLDVNPCCGEYETCLRPCTPRGRYLATKEAATSAGNRK